MSVGACHVLVAGSLLEHTSCCWEYPGAGLKGSQCGTDEPSEGREEKLQSKKMKRWPRLERTEGLSETCEEQTQRNSFQIWYSTKTQEKENYSDMEKSLQIGNTINVLKLNSFLM